MLYYYLGENVQVDDINYQDLTKLYCFKYALTTSVDIEQSFSIFRNILTNKRHSFTEDKLEMRMVIIIIPTFFTIFKYKYRY